MPHPVVPGFVTPFDATPQATGLLGRGPVVQLDDKIRTLFPVVVAVSIGNIDDKSTWKLYFKPEATQAEKDAAQQGVNDLDVQEALKQP